MKYLSIMKARTLPLEITELVARILRENERAFCIISDKYRPKGHPLPIYRVDENGRGVKCGHADILVVRDGMIIARADTVENGEYSKERRTEASEGCLYYECREEKEPEERGPYEFTKGCVVLKIV